MTEDRPGLPGREIWSVHNSSNLFSETVKTKEPYSLSFRIYEREIDHRHTSYGISLINERIEIEH